MRPKCVFNVLGLQSLLGSIYLIAKYLTYFVKTAKYVYANGFSYCDGCRLYYGWESVTKRFWAFPVFIYLVTVILIFGISLIIIRMLKTDSWFWEKKFRGNDG